MFKSKKIIKARLGVSLEADLLLWAPVKRHPYSLTGFTWFFSVGEAERGGDPGDRVEGDGEEEEDSKATKHD